VSRAATGSTLGRARKCAPSLVLPQIRREGMNRDRLGSAIHAHLAQRATTRNWGILLEGLDALAREYQLDEQETEIFRARCLSFDWTPPPGALAEVALGLLADGSVVRVEGGRGEYVAPAGGPPLVFALTIDVMWAEPAPLFEGDRRGGPVSPAPFVVPIGSRLVVVEYKTGDPTHTDAVEVNDQVRAGAALAAIWTGAEEVEIAVVYVRKGDGLWDQPEHTLKLADLDAIEADIRRVIQRVEEQRARHAAGLPLDGFTVGPHCGYCDAIDHCSAQRAALAQVLGDDALLKPGAPLDEATIRRLLVMAPRLEKLAERIDAEARRFVQREGRPVQLDGGKVWGPHEKQKDTIDPAKGFAILSELVGEELAKAAVQVKLTGTAVKAAIGKAQEAQGTDESKAAMVRRFYAMARKEGAIVPGTETWWSAHRPPAPALPEAEPPRVEIAEAWIPTEETAPPLASLTTADAVKLGRKALPHEQQLASLLVEIRALTTTPDGPSTLAAVRQCVEAAAALRHGGDLLAAAKTLRDRAEQLGRLNP
jgi:hypothetical protein